MSAASIAALCKEYEIDVQLDGLSIIFPGGFTIEANLPTVDIQTALDYAKALLGQANVALAPLQPVFSIIDVCIAIQKVLTAVKDALGPPPDPTKVVEALPNLAVKIDKLMALIPPVSLPVLVLSLLKVLLVFLTGLRAQIQAIIAFEAKIDLAVQRKAELQTFNVFAAAELQLSIECAQADASAMLAGQVQTSGPVNRLLDLLNLLIENSGLPLPKLPTLGSLGANASAALAPIDALILLLHPIRLSLGG